MSTPRDEINSLLESARKAAIHMMRGGKGFGPFSLVMAPDGAVRIMRAVLGQPDEPPKPIQEEVAYARQVLRTMAEKKEIKAAAMLGMGQARLEGQEGPSSVVIIEVEHEAGEAAVFCVPFEWKPDGEAELKKPAGRRREPIFFVRENPPDA